MTYTVQQIKKRTKLPNNEPASNFVAHDIDSVTFIYRHNKALSRVKGKLTTGHFDAWRFDGSRLIYLQPPMVGIVGPAWLSLAAVYQVAS